MLNRNAPLNRERIKHSEEPYVSARILSPEELRDLLSPYGATQLRAPYHEEQGLVPVEYGEWDDPFMIALVQR